MPAESAQSPSEKAESDSGQSATRTILTVLAILVVGGGIGGAIIYFEPTAKRSESTRETAMLVDTIQPEVGTFRPVVQAMGTVVPTREVILRPRVSGEILNLSEDFEPGGFVRQGDPVVWIDCADYENELARRASELAMAESELQLEMGRQEAAQMEFDLLDEEIPEGERALILRKPQLAAARANVAMAQEAVNRVELDLDRTTIAAPFDAHILSREVNVGSQVAPGDALGRVVGIDAYWVEATVPLSKLERLVFPGHSGEESTGSAAKIRSRNAWGEGTHREGRLHKLIGALENRTRMARVLVEVEDPLGRASETRVPPLMVGAYVEVEIEGRAIENCVRVPREHVRKNDTVWVMADGQLAIREVEVVFRDPDHAYIASGLTEEDRVVVTNLATVAEGAKLRTASGMSGEASKSEANGTP